MKRFWRKCVQLPRDLELESRATMVSSILKPESTILREIRMNYTAIADDHGGGAFWEVDLMWLKVGRYGYHGSL
jgi:hypothetical protein